jgi:hypothetical protein
LEEILRHVARRAVVLLELSEFVPGTRANVQAKIAVEVSHLERARKIARFDVPDHAAGIPVAAFPLLDNRPVGLRAVPGIQAQVGVQVPDQVALGTAGDAARTRKPTLIIEGHIALLLELVELDWAIIGAGLGHATAASALLDGQAVRIAGAALCSGLETLAASHIDQRHMLVIIQGNVSSRWQRHRGRDYHRCH